LGLLALLGPRTGVPTLQALCPTMARREVQDLARRYRVQWHRRHSRLARILHWQRPGTVWAMDFSEPPAPVDHVYPRLLAVRDLASGLQLLWLPVTDESAPTVQQALEWLFHEHGPPLVLKSDNGSAFIAEGTRALLTAWQVWPLPSPPRWPQYNGSCEAGIGSMKIRTFHQAARRGCPVGWSLEDTEAARQQANETARPWGMHGPTPQEAWQQCHWVSTDERTAFAITVRQRVEEFPPGPEVSPSELATNWRRAIVSALMAHDLLRFRAKRTAARP